MELTINTTSEEIKKLVDVYEYILNNKKDKADMIFRCVGKSTIDEYINHLENSFIINDANFDLLLETIVELDLPRYDNLLFMLINSDFMTPMSLESIQNPII